MEFMFIILGFILIYFIYQVISKGGIKGALFGSKVIRTLGEIPLKESGFYRQYLRIHNLENGNVGIELTSRAPFGFSMNGYSITKLQVDQLIIFLQNSK